MKHLKPIVHARREEQEKVGDGYEKPVSFLTTLNLNPVFQRQTTTQLDILSWLMDEAKDEEQTIESLMRRILVVNFAAIHSSSNVSYSIMMPLQSLTAWAGLYSALFYLAALPEYIASLRAEVEEEGWSKEGLDKMHKVDSFIEESQRMNPIGNRTVLLHLASGLR